MASSFSSQIEPILNLIPRLAPRRVLDIGKGLGKYGFLLHEYYGLDTEKRPDPSKTLAEQSRVVVDAVESNTDYLWPHIPQIYNRVYIGRIETLYQDLRGYELVLMLDVIEHLELKAGKAVISHFVNDGATLIMSTPTSFFQQELFESADEHHVSFWSPGDVRSLGFCVDYQSAGPGRIYLISQHPLDIRGFGKAPIKRLRRIVRCLKNELFD